MMRVLMFAGVMIFAFCAACSKDQSPLKEQVSKDSTQVGAHGEKVAPLEKFSPNGHSQQERFAASTLIYKGKKVAPSEFMAVVGITRGADRFPICTGTVIDQDLVLTAAHCICDGATSNIYIGHDPKARVVGNGYYRIAAWESGMQCNSIGTRDGLDLALLRTDKKILEAKPIRLASGAETDGSKFARVVGFGAVDANGSEFPYRKMEADVPVVSVDCGRMNGTESASDLFGCLPGSEMVAGKRSTPDTCSGDSGGPLLVSQNGDSRNAPYAELKLAGVTSRSTKDADQPCGAGGIYERLTPKAMTWVKQAIAHVRS